MNLFDQILLKLYSFLIFVFALIFILIGSGLFESEVYDALDSLYSSPNWSIACIVLSVIMALISIRFLLFGNRRTSTPQTINQRNELGEMRTSVSTFETIAGKAIQKVMGVREWQVRLKISEVDGHQFFIKVIVDGDIPIPQITEQIQREVKSKVEEITGVEIRQVSVLVTDVISSTAAKPRRVE